MISKYGIKIKNFQAGALYQCNLGVRENYDYTKAMFANNLLMYHLLDNGLKVDEKGWTRDIICIEFDYGSRSYSEEIKHLNAMIENTDKYSEEKINFFKYLRSKAEKNKDLVRFVSELIKLRKAHSIFGRKDFYGESEEEKKNGVDLVWFDFDGRVPDWSKLNRFLACELFGSRYTKKDGTKDVNFYIGMNTDLHDTAVILPALENGKVWTRVIDTSFPGIEDIVEEGKEEELTAQRRYIIPANSIVVLASK